MKLINTSIYSILLTFMLTSNLSASCSYELFSINSAKNTKIIDFIDQLSDECEFSIIVTDSHAEEFLNNTINKTHLKNLTIEEVLDIILKENNLSYTLQNNILKISYLTTKVFGIDYILSQRKGTGSTDITLSSSTPQNDGLMGSVSNSSTSTNQTNNNASNAESGMKIETSDEVRFWEELDLEFQRVLNRPSDNYAAEAPIINKNAGLITVTATSKQMKRFEDYLHKLQTKVQLQVLIDVQLLSVTMTEGRSTGIDWEQLYALQNITLESNYGKGSSSANFLTIQAGGSLNEVIKFLQTQGDVNSISNPKVLTLNNQPALITAGTEYFYKITQSANQQAASGGIAATIENDSVQSVFAGVLLDITPEIADDNTITLKINPSLSETRNDIYQASTDRKMPPDLNRRQLSSVVTIKDGNRIILGGLINTRKIKSSSKVPILGDFPIFHYLFKYEDEIKQVEELVIVIEPHIIQKEKNNLSLSDLGYEGLTDQIAKLINNGSDEDSAEAVDSATEEEENEL